MTINPQEIQIKPNRIIFSLTILLIIGISLAVSLPGTFSSGPIYPDGQRYTFNGILVHDMLRAGQLLNPYNFAVKFYAHYPATNLPYGSILHAAIFALGFSIFGISFAVARCITAGFAILAAVMCFYLVWKTEKKYMISVFSVVALLLNPLFGNFARDIAIEIPVIFYSLLSIYLFYNYVELGKKHYGLFTAISFSLGYLTKQYIFPLGLAFCVYVLLRKKYYLWKKESICSAIIVLLLTFPYTYLSIKYFSTDLGNKSFAIVNLEIIIGYFTLIFKNASVASVLAIFGFIIGLKNKNNLVLLMLIWVISWYLFFCLFWGHYYKEHRYFLIILPAFVYPCAIAVNFLAEKLKKYKLNYFVLAGFTCFFIANSANSKLFYVNGYEDAGRFIAENPYGKSVLFYGVYEGSFMMGVRQHIGKNKPYILRGDRLLANRLWWGELKSNESVKNPDEIINLFNKYQTGYIVIEKDMARAEHYKEYTNLINVVENYPSFQKIASYPIITNTNFTGSELVIYKYNYNFVETKGFLKIPVSGLKKEIEIDWLLAK